MLFVDKQRLPLLFITKVVVHQHWEVICLNVSVNIVRGYHTVYVLHWTDRVV